MSTYKFCGGKCPQCPLVPLPMDKSLISNYHPISLLCVLSKVLETTIVVHNRDQPKIYKTPLIE